MFSLNIISFLIKTTNLFTTNLQSKKTEKNVNQGKQIKRMISSFANRITTLHHLFEALETRSMCFFPTNKWDFTRVFSLQKLGHCRTLAKQ
jgi:hypothetical protein